MENRPHPNSERLGARLAAAGRISESDIEKALAFQQDAAAVSPRQAAMRLGTVLVRMGALSEESMLPVLAEQTGIPLRVDSDAVTAQSIQSGVLASGLAPRWWIDRDAVPFQEEDGVHGVLAKDALDMELQEAVASLPGIRWQIYWATSGDLGKARTCLQEGDVHSLKTDSVRQLRELAEEAPVIEFVGNVMAQAVDQRASDIHIEPSEREFEVRFRVDGVLTTQMRRPKTNFDAIASRVKLISGLDIAERRLPQDGRITTRVAGVEMDIRVSSIPGVHGESLVLRLLPKERADLSLTSLGMSPDHLAVFKTWLAQPNGIVLVTGPTGSGKSTTLYSALATINDRSLKIVTVEDPVEYRMQGVTQIQTHGEIGYTFARALRSILRHDPDVIMIGEIRDAETAEIAIQSALTGHLVLATIHTNDAPSAFTRLLEMGIEPFLLATSIRGVVAQRLIRKLDAAKSKPTALPQGLASEFADLRHRFPDIMPPQPLPRSPATSDEAEAYRGRSGIYEMLAVTPEVQDAILQRASAAEIASIARKAVGRSGFRTLREDGLIKTALGMTSIEEVLRIAGNHGAAESTPPI